MVFSIVFIIENIVAAKIEQLAVLLLQKSQIFERVMATSFFN